MTLVLVRPDDHLVLGVRWSGFTVAGSGTAARLVAGGQARLLLLLPPQHVGEESSPPGSAGVPSPTGAGGSVPTWRGVLSGPSRLAFAVAAGTEVPLTAAGLLAAVADNPLLTPAGLPGPDDTAIELPWRLVIAPHARSAGGIVVCRHPSLDAGGLWRTRLLDRTSAPQAAPPDAGLAVTVADEAAARAEDPAFAANNSIPLAKADRTQLFTETRTRPANVTRLELSALGGTLDAAGRWPNFEWDHRAVLGRDMHVRTLVRGAMYPFGHRAEFVQISERVHDPAAAGAEVLRRVDVLTIIEPVRRAPEDGQIRRAFPLGDVEITRTVYADLAAPDWQLTELGDAKVNTHFWPATLAGERVRFPVACATADGVVRFDLPMLFVADRLPAVDTLHSPVLARRLADDFPATEVRIEPVNLDLVGAGAPDAVAAAGRLPGDVQEVRALTIAGVGQGLDLAGGYRSRITELEVGLPALRSLQGNDARAKVAFAEQYLRNGATEDVLLHMLPGQTVPIDFSKQADRAGGLLAPSWTTNALSRSLGPVDRFSMPDPATGLIDPARLFPSERATLLGFPLRLLLTQLKAPPEITTIPRPGAAPEVRMRWRDVKLTNVGPFRAKPTTRLALTIGVTPGRNDIECVVSDFALELPPGSKAVLRLTFKSMRFTQNDGKAPKLEVTGVDAEFLGDLKLVDRLRDAVRFGDAGPRIDVRPSGITARYALPIPSISAGAFVMRNMAFTAGIEVPFDGNPVSILMGFSSRLNPFQLAVMMFGGGGYVELAIDKDGLKRFEAALEFGAFVAVDFVVASGEVHALGGVRFVLERDGSVTVTGYLRIGGTVEVLGLISVSVELVLALAYRSAGNALVGRATLVIEVDLTLWSERVELDSGEWKLAGDDPAVALTAAAERDGLERWRTYRAAFAGEGEHALALAHALRNPPEDGGRDE